MSPPSPPSTPSPTLSPHAGSESGMVETLLFVDVDGVLNVGIGDPGNATLEFSVTNVERTWAMWERRHGLSPAMFSCVERVASVHSRKAELMSAGDCLSDVAVGRLATLIHAAGARCSVVLSSTWRLPKHATRVRHLEESLSRHLDRPFTFHDRTSLNEDNTVDGRLRCIRDYVTNHCRAGLSGSSLRVLLLEDFHVSPPGWKCDGLTMGTAADVEEYLRACAPDSVDISAKLIHTYDEWFTESGLHVQVGSGLTEAHVCDALTFLDGTQGGTWLADLVAKMGSVEPQPLVTCML